jgi:3-dehydroquinate synthase class II
MPHIQTIEEDYEYRIKKVVKQLIRDSIDIDDLKRGDQLMDFLSENAERFGKAIIDDMSEWTSDADWLYIVKQ